MILVRFPVRLREKTGPTLHNTGILGRGRWGGGGQKVKQRTEDLDVGRSGTSMMAILPGGYFIART